MKSNVTEKWEKEGTFTQDFIKWAESRDDDWWEDGEGHISIWDVRVMFDFIKEELNAFYHQGVEDGKAEIMKLFSEEREKLLKGFGYKKEIK